MVRRISSSFAKISQRTELPSTRNPILASSTLAGYITNAQSLIRLQISRKQNIPDLFLSFIRIAIPFWDIICFTSRSEFIEKLSIAFELVNC